MGNKASQVKAAHEDEDTRGSSGCFGWVSRALKRKKRGRRPQEPTTTPSAAVEDVGQELEKEQDGEELVGEEQEKEQDGEELVGEEQDGEELVGEEQEKELVGEEREKEQDSEELVGEEREKEQDGEEPVGEEPEVVLTWAEEVDDAEEKGLDVFAPLSSCLPHTECVPSESSDSTENELTAAAATKMSACQRRRARRRAVAAAREAQAASETAVTLEKPRASAQHEAESAATHNGASVTQRRRARRKALAGRLRSEALLAETAEEQPATDTTPAWPSPSVRVFGSDGRPFVTAWEEAAYGAFHAQRQY